MSGPDAIITAKNLFRPKNPLIWSRLQAYNMTYGMFFENGVAVDEAICLVFRAPKSYTGEDVVEFSCHGGLVVLRKVLRAVLAAGVRHAEPGEFTKRAFLHGRIDLARAESVMQLVSAQNEQAAQAAAAAMGGALSRHVTELRTDLLRQTARLAAWNDYPEEEQAPFAMSDVRLELERAQQSVIALLRQYETNRSVLHGVECAIVGRPNVGKSTLMNCLLGYERAIVSEEAGTTRDTVAEDVQIGAITLRLIDTAGIRESTHALERLGVARSRAAMAAAGLIFFVYDASQPLHADDLALLAACPQNRTLMLANKSDLAPGQRPVHEELALPREARPIPLSAKTGEGIDLLRAAIEELLCVNEFVPQAPMIANERQRQCIAETEAALREALRAMDDGFYMDATQICLEDAIQAIDCLTGARATEAVVEEVFAQFCVGK
jgi:tRNA modification GTPase